MPASKPGFRSSSGSKKPPLTIATVFECLLMEKDAARLKQAVMKVIHPRTDRVRCYSLCASCVAKVEVASGVEVLRENSQVVGI
ncbi:MAG TPA: CRISPR-associated endonuclease Cas2 [Anaerolineae bacterium]|nr:CRISPR-associated endonuclease Cas2 [Anaerolineae bacterium]